MDQFNQIDHDYISRIFNDRRPGGGFKHTEPPKGGNWSPGSGTTKLPRKPKSPHSPVPGRAVALKHEVKGY
jgi:hypothetical protein